MGSTFNRTQLQRVNIMNKLVLGFELLANSALCTAQQVGRVIIATPIIGQVAVSHEFCRTEQVALQRATAGAGALMAALMGLGRWFGAPGNGYRHWPKLAGFCTTLGGS